ncbi:hypothetical protein [Rhodococcus sp. SGAir0479]|uniref:hypothetical protein n=1 Tax=Rhodococcus sp. SGAir0479 TaxID=2567884 RepID=UPI0010CD08B8|nr:hypothetical protein [Rhodococcus sp. SGAir0479]QCQ90202.1 hypothetical protein E7742_02540 [Rhodococcus sp. SGAir0479]
MGRNKGRTTATIVAASALVVALAACNNDGGTSEETKEKISSAVTSTTEPSPGEEVQSSASSVVSGLQQSASSAVSGLDRAWDNAKLATFVASFRTFYPNLASDRDDESIETVVKDTCSAIDSGASAEEQVAKVKETAANGGTEPTDEQADRILQMVKPACP